VFCFAFLPLPFCRCRSVVPLPFFRSVAAIAVARKNGIAGNVFPLLFCHQRQNGKNRIRSYLLWNGSYGIMAGGNGNGTTDFFYVGNIILTALTNSYGICVTATAKRQLQNGTLETRHQSECLAGGNIC